jgi:hypothetical protein
VSGEPSDEIQCFSGESLFVAAGDIDDCLVTAPLKIDVDVEIATTAPSVKPDI